MVWSGRVLVRGIHLRDVQQVQEELQRMAKEAKASNEPADSAVREGDDHDDGGGDPDVMHTSPKGHVTHTEIMTSGHDPRIVIGSGDTVRDEQLAGRKLRNQQEPSVPPIKYVTPKPGTPLADLYDLNTTEADDADAQ